MLTLVTLEGLGHLTSPGLVSPSEGRGRALPAFGVQQAALAGILPGSVAAMEDVLCECRLL